MRDFTLDNIDTSFEGYQQLINLYNENKDCLFEDINLSFNKWFGANMSSALGGILDKLTTGGLNTVNFKLIPDNVKAIIQKNDFLSHFGFRQLDDNHHTTIKYLKLKPTDGRFFHNYVVEELLNRPELPEMTISLKKKIAESIYEMFVNARIHSESNFIYTCGQFFPTKHKIEFTITDTGVGFKHRVDSRFNINISAIKAIKWAITDKHSTKQGIPGGIGLAILKEFIMRNKGKIQIISGNGFYQLDSFKKETKKEFSGNFPGTIINMQFRTDDPGCYFRSNKQLLDDIF